MSKAKKNGRGPRAVKARKPKAVRAGAAGGGDGDGVRRVFVRGAGERVRTDQAGARSVLPKSATFQFYTRRDWRNDLFPDFYHIAVGDYTVPVRVTVTEIVQ